MKRKYWIGITCCMGAAFIFASTAQGGMKRMLPSKVAGVAEVLEDVTEEETEQTKERLAEEPKDYWGYQNLGIAHVDNHLNVREEANESAKLVGKMSKDTACEILSIKDNWAHIKSGKVEGYASMDYLYTGDEAIERAKEVVTTLARVDTQTLKVRGEPTTDSITLTLVAQEEELEVVEVLSTGWAKIMLDDEEAYVSTDYVKLEERLGTAVTMTELQYGQGISDVRVNLVKFAQKYIGNPYVWGGVSLTKGADCSGFVLSVFKNFGVSLPRSSRAQVGSGRKVTAAEIQPGDLVFYAKNGTVNHVAIYIGGGQVVHASSPRTGIKVSNWKYRTPYEIRRVLA